MADRRDGAAWDGRTYYGRPQLKPAPFHTWLVGSYMFLAGLSGAAQVLATVLDLGPIRGAEATVRRGRLLSLLAPTIGTLCLVFDLQTPKRFYNMLRLVKTTSPMSLGSWTLVGFSGASMLTALQSTSRSVFGHGLIQALARVAQIPAALTGGILATYTASLLSATSTPRWAIGAKSLAVRFAAASVASAAAALSLGEGCNGRARDLDNLAVAALTVELGATVASDHTQRRAGIRRSPSMRDYLGIMLPLGLFVASQMLPRHARKITTAASMATLAGSLIMRIGIISDGNESAQRPQVSLRFAQPDNLPRA